MNPLQQRDLLKEAVASMPRNALLSLTRYHQAALEEAMAHLVTAPLENVPALQATAQVHQGVIQALNAGA